MPVWLQTQSTGISAKGTMKQKPKLSGLKKWVTPRRLLLDLETSPDVVYSWRIGSKVYISPENIVQERAIICIGYKWQGEKRTHCLTWDKGDDKAMLEKFIPILESADEVVAHFGDRFDMPWLRARAAFHGIPVSPYIKTVDTKAQSARLFYFNSNKLDYLGQFLGLGQKIETDYKLWKRVMAGERAALREMVSYCKEDVRLLERVYLRLESYNKPKTHQGVTRGGIKSDCPQCGSVDTMRIGMKVTGAGTRRPRMKCRRCGSDFLITALDLARKEGRKRRRGDK